jgi:penicillin-insensitive murein endopeptidase
MLALAAALIAAGALPASDADASLKRSLPGEFQRAPYSLMSLSVGYPNQGWQLRPKRLRDTPYLRVREGSRDAAFGHPALVLMLRRSAAQIGQRHAGSLLVVGDVSVESGGPLSGHVSHQSGRDADVGFYVRTRKGTPVVPERFTAFDANGIAKNGSGLRFDDARNWLLVEAWVKDPRAGLAHVFVSRELRQRLLAHAREQGRPHEVIEQAAQLLKQPPGVSPHDDHFHVRIACPKRHERICHDY